MDSSWPRLTGRGLWTPLQVMALYGTQALSYTRLTFPLLNLEAVWRTDPNVIQILPPAGHLP